MGCRKISCYTDWEDLKETSDIFLRVLYRKGRASKKCSNYYTFGFNGMEKEVGLYDDESAYDFGARIYDSRIGKFMSIDPKWKDYPFASTYGFAANNPIRYIDKNGESVWLTYWETSAQAGHTLSGGAMIQLGTANDNYGTTFYEVTGTQVLDNDLGKSREPYIGANGDLIAIGKLYDWGSSSFKENMKKTSPVIFSGGPFDFGIGDDMVSIDFGISEGAGIGCMSIDGITSYSFAEKEVGFVNNHILKKGKMTIYDEQAQYDNDGNITGYIGFLGYDGKDGKFHETGMRMSSDVIDGNENSRMWESFLYQEEISNSDEDEN